MKKMNLIMLVIILNVSIFVLNAQEYFREDFNTLDTTVWSVRDDNLNGPPFNSSFNAKNVSIETIDGNSFLVLTLNNVASHGRLYSGAEVSTFKKYGYGTYTVRAKLVSHRGVVSSIFGYSGTWGQATHREWDLEMIYKGLQLNYYNGKYGAGVGHEKIVPIQADEFHIYKIIWTPGSLKIYIDDILEVEYSAVDLPDISIPIFMNIWSGDSTEWLSGEFNGESLYAYYDYLIFEPLYNNSKPILKINNKDSIEINSVNIINFL